MDASRLRTGQLIAGVAGVALLLIMFIFSWYGVKDAPDEFGGLNAWEAYSFIDIVLFITIVVAVGLAAAAAMAQRVSLPVAASALTAGLGILSVLLILFRIIVTPDLDVPELDVLGLAADIELGVKFGAFLGLIAAAGIAYGGWRSMQEEGTTFAGEADRIGDRDTTSDRDTSSAAPPPPPPPSSTGGPGAPGGTGGTGV